MCSYTLQQTARDATNFDADVIESVKRDVYVDDYLRSVETPAEAKKATREISRLLRGGGFRLRKWVGNSRGVATTDVRD